MLKAITAQVTRDFTPEDALPLTLQNGDRVRISQPHPERANYVWADDGGLCAGWVPTSVLHINGSTGIANSDFCSAELSVNQGETVRVMWRGEGFDATWCESSGGERGWLPNDALAFNRNAEDGE